MGLLHPLREDAQAVLRAEGAATMKVLGADPSSTISGFAVTEGARLDQTFIWERYKEKSGAWNLWQYFRELNVAATRLKIEEGVDIACVEFLSVMRNANTTRVVSHYQAATVIACKQAGMMVVEARVSSARKEALGNGGLSKDDAFAEIKRRYPDHKFKPKTRGGTDETDAVVLALAAEGLIEG